MISLVMVPHSPILSTSIVAGENISLNLSTGNVTITGLAKTDNINADTLVVTGITTLGVVTNTTSVQLPISMVPLLVMDHY